MTSNNENWDVVIVGAGPSGLGVGAQLAHAGKKVLVLEKEKTFGGRASTSSHAGVTFDNGPHAPMMSGDLEKIFERIGKPAPVMGTQLKKTEVWHEGAWVDLKDMYPHGEMKKLIAELLATSHEELQDKYDDVSLADWLDRRAEGENVRMFLWYFGATACAEWDPDGLSAGDVLGAVKRVVEHWGGFGAHAAAVAGGMKHLYTPWEQTIRENGGEIRTGTKVSDIVIGNSTVRGVNIEAGERIIASQFLDTEFIAAPVVVNTLPLWDFFTVVNEDEFPRWYVEWIRGMAHKTANVWSLNYALDAPLFDESIFRWVPELPRVKMGVWPMPFSTYGESVGQYNVSFLIQASWDQLPNLFEVRDAKVRADIKKWFELFEEDINELFPEIKEHTIWMMRQACTYNIAETPGYVGNHRPGIQPPKVKNLYLCSDTLKDARIGGTQAAAIPIVLCADLILGRSDG